MSATNTTPHVLLPLFIVGDKPAWLVDWNSAMNLIDTALYTALTNASNALALAEDAGDDIGTLQTQVSAIETSIATINGQITALQSGQTTINDTIAVVQSTLTTLSGTVSSLVLEVATKEAKTIFSEIDTTTTVVNYTIVGGTEKVYTNNNISQLDINIGGGIYRGLVASLIWKKQASATIINFLNHAGLPFFVKGDDVAGGVFIAVANKMYTFIFVYDGVNLICYISGV